MSFVSPGGRPQALLFICCGFSLLSSPAHTVGNNHSPRPLIQFIVATYKTLSPLSKGGLPLGLRMFTTAWLTLGLRALPGFQYDRLLTLDLNLKKEAGVHQLVARVTDDSAYLRPAVRMQSSDFRNSRGKGSLMLEFVYTLPTEIVIRKCITLATAEDTPVAEVCSAGRRVIGGAPNQIKPNTNQ